MKPTADIVEELRLYNRWRRGDEAITAPDPTALGRLLDEAADRIEHLFASGIHTCHADCQRPLCVLRRERDAARAAHAVAEGLLAKTTSLLTIAEKERDDVLTVAKERAEEFRREAHAHFVAAGEIEELEAELSSLRASLARESAELAELRRQRDRYHDALTARHGGEPIALLDEIDSARVRVAELEDEIERNSWSVSPAMAQAKIDQLSVEVASLRRDRERLDWMLANGDPLEIWINTDRICVENRDAIDAAMKEEAAP